MSTRGPLSNVKVLDVGTYGVGPGAAATLGFLGARVIRVENPSGDPFFDNQPTMGGMGASYINANLQKEVHEIDLKSKSGQAAALRLAEHMDILVENRLPGVMERLGLGYEAVSAVNPQVIYVSCPGFGTSGPYAGKPALDTHVQALSGFASLEGPDGGQPELFRVYAHLDHTAAAALVQASLLGLIARKRTGTGMKLDVPHLSAAIFLQITRLAEYFASAQSPTPTGSADPRVAPSQSLRCRDGRFVNITTPDDCCWDKFCRAAGLDDLLSDKRFVSNRERVKNRSALAELIERRLMEAPSWWWILHLTRNGVACGPVSDPTELLHNTRISDHFLVSVYTKWGRVWHAQHPWVFSRTPCPPMHGPRNAVEVAAPVDESSHG